MVSSPGQGAQAGVGLGEQVGQGARRPADGQFDVLGGVITDIETDAQHPDGGVDVQAASVDDQRDDVAHVGVAVPVGARAHGQGVGGDDVAGQGQVAVDLFGQGGLQGDVGGRIVVAHPQAVGDHGDVV